MRLDGFVSMDAGYASPAVLTTVPVVVGGSRLYVNLEAPNGALRVALLGEDGHALRGFGLDDSTPLSVNSVNASVAWAEQPMGTAGLVGQTVVVQFWLIEAKLYAFQWLP